MKNIFAKSVCAVAWSMASLVGFASVPLAVWDGNNTNLGSFTLTADNGNSIENDVITITEGATGGVVYSGADNSLNNCTFIIRCTGLDLASGKNQHLISLHQNNLDEASYNKVGVCMAAISGTDTKSNVRGIWENNIYNTQQKSEAFESGTDIVINIQQQGGVFVYEIVTDSNGVRSLEQRYGSSGLKSSSSNYKGFSIGGVYVNGGDNLNASVGWTISKMAVFGSTLSESEILTYLFPSETKTYTLNIEGSETSWSSAAWKCGDETVPAPTTGEVEIIASGTAKLNLDMSVTLAKFTFTGDNDVVLTLNGLEGTSFFCRTMEIKKGVLKQGTGNALSATYAIYVEEGGTLDLNGYGTASSTQLYLAGTGAGTWPWALTSSSADSGNILGNVTLTSNAVVGGAHAIKIGEPLNGYHLYLNGFTLMKVGNGAFVGYNMNTPREGTIDMQGGNLSANQWNNLNSSSGDTTLILREGSSFTQNSSSHAVSVNTLEWIGGILNTPYKFTVKSSLYGGGETARLAFNDGANAFLSSDLTVTTLLTAHGALNFVKAEPVESVKVKVAGVFSASGNVFVGTGVTLNIGVNRPAGIITVDEGGTLELVLARAADFPVLKVSAKPDNVILYDVDGSRVIENSIVNYDAEAGTITVQPPINTLNAVNGNSFDASENWSLGLPTEGDDVVIWSTEDVTISVAGEYTLGTVHIGGGGTIVFNGDGTINAERIEVMPGASYCATGSVIPEGTPHIVHGTLKTNGDDVTLSSAANVVDPAGVLDVESGTLTFTCGDRTLKGTVYVREGATLAPQTTDAFNYSGTQVMHVYGTLAMGDKRWTTGGNNTIYLYGGASVTGGGNNAGNIDFNASGAGHIVVKRNEETGDCVVNFSAALRSNNNDNGTIVIDPGVTLVMSGKLINARKITKSGAGHLVFDTPNDSTGGYIWVSEGTVGGKGFVYNITMVPGTVLQPVPGGLSVNGFYVNPNDTDQKITLNSGRINHEMISDGTEFTLFTVTGDGLSIPTGKINVSLSSRYQAAISGKTITATVKGGLPTNFFHYDYNSSDGVASDSTYTCGTYNGNGLLGKRDGAINIKDTYTPYYSANSSEKSPFYAGEISIAALVKIKEDSVTNTIMWNYGSATADGIAVIAKDSSTVALVSWENGTAATEVVAVSGIEDLLKRWHLITIVATADGTTLYVDGKSNSTEKIIPFSIDQKGQFGSIYGDAKGYNKFGMKGLLLDDYRFYDAALTYQEVKSLKSELNPAPFIIMVR